MVVQLPVQYNGKREDRGMCKAREVTLQKAMPSQVRGIQSSSGMKPGVFA